MIVKIIIWLIFILVTIADYCCLVVFKRSEEEIEKYYKKLKEDEDADKKR